jgi:hypothetical protein
MKATRRNITTLFRIKNQNSLQFPFKLMQLDLQEIDNDPALNNRNLEKVLMKVASKTAGPVAPYHKDGKRFIAVRANTQISTVDISLAPMNAKATLLPEIYTLNMGSLSAEEIELTKRFLEFTLKEHLANQPAIWRYSSQQYFLRRPLYNDPHSEIDVFSGFNFQVVYNSDNMFYIGLDLAYKYTDKKFLHERLEGLSPEAIKKRLKGKKCLYFGGDSWYMVQIAAFAKAIHEQDFSIDGKRYTVYEWALNHTKSETFNMKKHLLPDSPSLVFNYPNNTSKYFNGAACLAKLVYNTASEFVNGMHSKTLTNPDSRFKYLSSFIRNNFKGALFNGIQLSIDERPHAEELKVFPLPGLKYNGNVETKTFAVDQNYERNIADFPKQRKSNIIKNGILNNSLFNPQYLLIPDSIDAGLSKAICNTLNHDMKVFAKQFEGFALITYKDLRSTSAYKQYQEIKTALNANGVTHGKALFVLPEEREGSGQYIKNLHDCVKKNFYRSVQFQCAASHKIASFFRSYFEKGIVVYRLAEDSLRSYRSYVANLFFEHLIINQRWPYALSKNLNYDIYIGLDVHDHYAGFTFFYRNGEKIVFDFVEVSNKTGTYRNEKISARVITERLLDNLKRHIPAHAKNPNGIVLVRDGRSFGEEPKALKLVIEELSRLGLVNKESLQYGIVDIHKSTSMPYRVALDTNGFPSLVNPISGTYKMFNNRMGFLFTTGYPFKINGTVHPIQVSLVEGSVDMEKVMNDIFNQCIMAFSAPDKGSSLPVVLKLIDTMIRPFAHQVTDFALEEHEEEVQSKS